MKSLDSRIMTPRFSQCFSLIELLVVISIISILASFLLPSLLKSRKSAQAAVCISNLKNLSLAMNMYTDDNDGSLLVSRRLTSNQHVWWKAQMLMQLRPNERIEVFNNGTNFYSDAITQGEFKCPLVDNGVTDLYAGGYGYNTLLGSLLDDQLNINDLIAPSQTYAMGDGSDEQSLPSWKLGLLRRASLGVTEVGNRHKNGMNIVHADGSVIFKKQVSVLSGANGDVNWYYKIDK